MDTPTPATPPPEPLAAILADYRADIHAMQTGELPHPTPEYLRILLNRIEAAAEMRHRIDVALSAPARNCDRFRTADDARRAFESAHSHGIVHNLYTAAFGWLLAPATEGGDHA